MKDIEIPKDHYSKRSYLAMTIEGDEDETRDITATSRQLALPSNQRHMLFFKLTIYCKALSFVESSKHRLGISMRKAGTGTLI